MQLLQGLFTGWVALRGNKLRSLLTMLGIVIGTGGVIGTMSFGDGARHLVLAQVEKMGGTSTFNVRRPHWIQRDGRWMRNPSQEYIRLQDVALIEELCPSVKSVTPDVGRDVGLQTGAGSKRSNMRATTTAYRTIRNWLADTGRFIEEPDVSFWTKVVVIGTQVATDLFGNMDPIGQELRMNNQRFTVVGVMESKGGGGGMGDMDSQVFIPITTANSTFFGTRRIDNLLLEATSSGARERAQKEVEVVLRRYHGGEDFFRIYSQAADMAREANIMGAAIKIALGVVAGMSLLVGGIGILNIMLVSVAERIREIGLRKAVGATRLDIAVQFLMEGVLLCVVGSVIGILFGYLTERALAFAVIKFIMKGGEWPSLFSWTSVTISVTVGSVTGVVAGLGPAISAARLPPVDALRHH
jgi:putative ABC transport system permease protein